jgi:hypothetical protein
VKRHLSFDVIHRTKNFHKFESDPQFGQIAEQLAASALEKVIEYRRLFRTILQVSEYYVQNVPTTFWPYFDAAIAHSLSGRVELGRHLLSKCAVSEAGDPPWLAESRNDASLLASMAHQSEKFREAVVGRVRETRRWLNLSPLSQVDFGSERVVVG